MSRGLSNRNPGNIRQSAVRYKGEVRPSRDPAFKQFESMPWGYRAIFVLLDTYRIRHGLDTIRGMISRWAPPSENRTEIYIRAVADAVHPLCGCLADEAKAHRHKENCSFHYLLFSGFVTRLYSPPGMSVIRSVFLS